MKSKLIDLRRHKFVSVVWSFLLLPTCSFQPEAHISSCSIKNEVFDIYSIYASIKFLINFFLLSLRLLAVWITSSGIISNWLLPHSIPEFFPKIYNLIQNFYSTRNTYLNNYFAANFIQLLCKPSMIDWHSSSVSNLAISRDFEYSMLP